MSLSEPQNVFYRRVLKGSKSGNPSKRYAMIAIAEDPSHKQKETDSAKRTTSENKFPSYTRILSSSEMEPKHPFKNEADGTLDTLKQTVTCSKCHFNRNTENVGHKLIITKRMPNSTEATYGACCRECKNSAEARYNFTGNINTDSRNSKSPNKNFFPSKPKQRTLPRPGRNPKVGNSTSNIMTKLSPSHKSPSLESFLNDSPEDPNDVSLMDSSEPGPLKHYKQLQGMFGTSLENFWPLSSSRRTEISSNQQIDGELLNKWRNTNCVARALYDNVAESPDELAFCKGDLLTVLEQNTAGLEGWWLCSLRGRQGICPGNRLRIVPGCYDTGSGLTSLSGVQRVQRSVSNVQSQQRTPSKKVITPKRVGDVFTYDTPRSLASLPQTDYDVPRHQQLGDKNQGKDCSRLSRSSSLRYDTPKTSFRSSLEQYDSPHPQECQYDSPTSRPVYDSPKAAQMQIYDTPRLNETTNTSTYVSRSLIKGIRGSQQPEKDITLEPNQNQQEYDVPRPLSRLGDVHKSDRTSNISLMSCDSQLSTSSSASSIQASESLSLSSAGGGSSNRSSLEAQDVYDIPPEPRKFVQSHQKPKLPPREGKDFANSKFSAVYDTPPSQIMKSEVVYDVPPQVSRDTRTSDTFELILNRLSSGSESSGADLDLLTFKELPLELDSAMETLSKFDQEVLSAAEKVSTVKNSKTGDDKSEEVKLVIFRLKEALGELLNFCRGSIGNAFRAGEHKLAKRISRLVDPIESAYIVTNDAWTRLETLPSALPAAKAISLEQLKQVASIATSLSENVRHLTNVIKGNAEAIFKRSPIIKPSLSKKKQIEDEEKTPVQERPLPELPFNISSKGPSNDNEPHSWIEDYDYVNLESKESVEKEHKEIMESLPKPLRKSYDNLVKQSLLIVDSDHRKAIHKTENEITGPSITPTNNQVSKVAFRLDTNDRQVLNFYGAQSKLHLQNLNSAIDAFLLTIENNQPPKVFIAHSKFVILSAHKLVYIGDTIHRNVVNSEIRTVVLNCTNALCDAMKHTVAAAKTAALQFPSVTAVQTMVDAFVSVSHLSNNLKRAICRD